MNLSDISRNPHSIGATAAIAVAGCLQRPSNMVLPVDRDANQSSPPLPVF